MARFLFVFISIYTGMHAFVFSRARVLLPERWLAQFAVVLFLAMMIFAPIATRLLERNGYDVAARVMAHAGYTWMGFIFVSFWVFLMVGAVSILSRGAFAFASVPPSPLPGKACAMAVLVLSIIVCSYGYLEARFIRIERVRIETAKLPEGVDQLKIAQISDVHLGLIVRETRLRKIIEKILSEDPDILVSTGDLIDGNIGPVETISEMFRLVNPRYGKFAVLGNHEVYAGLAQSIDLTRSFGFEVLRGEARKIDNIINIAGVDDPAVAVRTDEVSLLSSIRTDLFTLLIKHRPDVVPESQGLFDLQLSGHTHRGQIFPFRFLSAVVYPLQHGLYDLNNASRLYTSPGTGTWGPPMRVFSPPEVTIIELVLKTEPLRESEHSPQ